MNHQLDRIAILQLTEISLDDAVLMEIDQTVIRCSDLAKALISVDLGNASLKRRLVAPGLASNPPLPSLELTFHSVEGIANGDIQVFMCVHVTRFVVDGEFLAWNSDFQLNLVAIAFMLATVWGPHINVATRYAIEELLELVGMLANRCLDGGGAIHVMKMDFQRSFHGYLSLVGLSRTLTGHRAGAVECSRNLLTHLRVGHDREQHRAAHDVAGKRRQ